jgi:hypothetical protein
LPGDLITGVNGQSLQASMSQDDVTQMIIGAGRPFQMQLVRPSAVAPAAQQQLPSAAVAAASNALAAASAEQAPAAASDGGYVATFEAGKLGLAFARQDDGQVTVQRVSLQAESCGCLPGDLITGVNGQSLQASMSQDDVTQMIIGAGRPFQMQFMRGGHEDTAQSDSVSDDEIAEEARPLAERLAELELGEGREFVHHVAEDVGLGFERDEGGGAWLVSDVGARVSGVREGDEIIAVGQTIVRGSAAFAHAGPDGALSVLLEEAARPLELVLFTSAAMQRNRQIADAEAAEFARKEAELAERQRLQRQETALWCSIAHRRRRVARRRVLAAAAFQRGWRCHVSRVACARRRRQRQGAKDVARFERQRELAEAGARAILNQAPGTQAYLQKTALSQLRAQRTLSLATGREVNACAHGFVFSIRNRQAQPVKIRALCASGRSAAVVKAVVYSAPYPWAEVTPGSGGLPYSWRRVGSGPIASSRSAANALPLYNFVLIPPFATHAFLVHCSSSPRAVGFNLEGCVSSFTDGAIARDGHIDIMPGTALYATDPMDLDWTDCAECSFSGSVEYAVGGVDERVL